jgi:hypothetical protein
VPPLRTALVLALVAAAGAPAAAQARPQAQPLVDLRPVSTNFKDRVLHSSATTARAAATADFHAYPTKDGSTVAVAISAAYGGQLASVAQSYVDFLDSMPHGPELSKLRIIIATPDEVLQGCGGVEGTLACYDSGTEIMLVPGEQMADNSTGVTTSYVVAHEYGHHIAANRSNAPFSAFQFGPKYWASYERVCNLTTKNELFPGNETIFYKQNPGEAWAETYAHLTYPTVPWQFTPLLKPDQAGNAAALQDVLNPWKGPVRQVYKGSFGAHGSNTRRFSFDLTLDGALSARLHGPRSANYNLVISSNGRDEGRTSKAGGRDRLSYQAACRQTAVEHVTVTVKRVTGSGPFTLRLSYAG